MSPEEINQAIAEWLGWRAINTTGLCRRVVNGFEEFGVLRDSELTKARARMGLPPSSNLLLDYYNDLNACREVRRKLPLTLRSEYSQRLQQISQKGRMATVDWTLLDASAPQHCEALLKTIGKWKDQ